MNSSTHAGLFPWQSPRFKSPRPKIRRTPGIAADQVKFGTPNFPSPLDRIRNGRNTRAADLGLSARKVLSKSFEGNQSFPRCSRRGPRHLEFDSATPQRRDLLRSLANDHASFSFSMGGSRGSFAETTADASWCHRSYIGGTGQSLLEPVFANSVINPNKMLFCLDENGKILTCNDMALQILGFNEKSSFHGLSFWEMLIGDDAKLTLPETDVNQQGNTYNITGKVVEMKQKDGTAIALSLWTKHLTESNRTIAVMEPVERQIAKIWLGPNEKILSIDATTESIFQETSAGLCGKNIHEILPQIKIPDVISEKGFRQAISGLTVDGLAFPVLMLIQDADAINDTQNMEATHRITIWVYSQISGLIVISPDGVIESYNSGFVSMLFGYKSNDLIGKNVETLIPGFYSELELIMGPYSHELYDSDDDLGCRQLDGGGKISSASSDDEVEIRTELKCLTSTPAGKEPQRTVHLRSEKDVDFPEGSFFGMGKHKDGAEFSILYQIKRVILEDGSFVFCLWISRDPEEPAEGGRKFGSLTPASSINTSIADKSLGQAIRNHIEKRQDHPGSGSIIEADESIFTRGRFAEEFETLHQIGRGAFGCVKACYRKADKRRVVTKFIKKNKIYEEYWVTDKVLGSRVPLEVSLLTTLDHPNIVKVLNVFENEDYFQMVMEKHGSGMDLFEFIDRNPKMDEALTCHIFRQVVDAVEYLHERKILHRDIKDENIIIDQNFHIKLIDFGSATFRKEGWLYSTFYGTVEYCSPEVLEGHHYQGPELEMWSLGVLLYILIFGENPFFTIDETIACCLQPPFSVSPLCLNLVKSILCKDLKSRFNLQQIKAHVWMTQEVDVSRYSFEDVIPCSEEELRPPSVYIKDEDLHHIPDPPRTSELPPSIEAESVASNASTPTPPTSPGKKKVASGDSGVGSTCCDDANAEVSKCIYAINKLELESSS